MTSKVPYALLNETTQAALTASNEIRNVDTNTDCTGTGLLIGETRFSANCTSAAGSSAAQANAFHWAASAEFV